ncbi:Fic family protein [Pseudomonas sp. MWU16-30317]|uniref:Fic family protein n=1 Tax=Pseudomonas sp. MWU16-30317 TaxID=2878095 RepID=UPI001CFC2E0C|nr:Fic family protein [Pseudomonas sp. MWU16-30317]
MITRPPPVDPNPIEKIVKDHPSLAVDYLQLFTPTDRKGRYQHYDTLRFRIPRHLDHGLAWSVVKSARRLQLTDLVKLGVPMTMCRLLNTTTIQKAASASDRYASTAALEWMSQQIDEQEHISYLLNDLIEDEAISSSQLEGAATTTKVAKDLLKRQRAPRTLDEKMIVGNFKMMQAAWRFKDRPLSAGLIAELHCIGVENIDDSHYQPGVFRSASDDIVVEDGDGNVVHTPPPGIGLEKRLQTLADWLNTDHTDAESEAYLHPLIKAITLHFAIGYEHPFHDGNGRVARSLFYWYLFKHDFAAFRYIAISTLLKSAPVQYGKSYLYTETDEMDLTYFIDYQCTVINRAIGTFKATYEKTLLGMQAFKAFLYQSGLYTELNDKQKTVLQVAQRNKGEEFTATTVKDNLGCSYNTASAVLHGLVEHQLFNKRKDGREWVYFMIPAQKLIKGWSI